MIFTKEGGHLTEKGNLNKLTTNGLKAKALEKIAIAGLEATPDGDYAVELGVSEDGTPWYLTVAITVGKADPFVKHDAKKKEKAPVEAPDLSGILD